MPPSPARQPAPGAVLAGRYRILEKIGTGWRGEVYRGVDEQSKEAADIKLLRIGPEHDLARASSHFEGAWTASLMRHPNIVQVHETGLSEFGPFIVMEPLRGENVMRVLERHGRLKRESCFAIIEPVLLALGAAHSIGLLHGHVKPENVILCLVLDSRVAVKVVDFGATVALTPTEQLECAHPYRSPEQVQGKPMDHRSDLFSTCVLLYELLTNALPFHGPTAAATNHRIVHQACPPLSQMGLLGVDGISDVLLRGLEKDPSRRYSNVRDLLDALRPVMQTETPPSLLLSELIALIPMLRQESGTMPASAIASQRPRATSSPSPDSGARLASAFVRASRVPPSIRPDAPYSSNPPERDALAPVLPARYRGRYRARAIVWQALDAYVRSRRPPAIREQILYQIGTDDASDLLIGTLQGIVYCDLDSITQYVELATAQLFSGDPTWCRAAGRDSVEGVLSVALTRSIPPTPNVVVTLRRVCRIVGPLFDFGEWQVEQNDDPRRALVCITGLDALCQSMRWWIVGIIERALSVMHQNPQLTVTRGEGSFMPRMVIDVVTN